MLTATALDMFCMCGGTCHREGGGGGGGGGGLLTCLQGEGYLDVVEVLLTDGGKVKGPACGRGSQQSRIDGIDNDLHPMFNLM